MMVYFYVIYIVSVVILLRLVFGWKWMLFLVGFWVRLCWIW